ARCSLISPTRYRHRSAAVFSGQKEFLDQRGSGSETPTASRRHPDRLKITPPLRRGFLRLNRQTEDGRAVNHHAGFVARPSPIGRERVAGGRVRALRISSVVTPFLMRVRVSSLPLS